MRVCEMSGWLRQCPDRAIVALTSRPFTVFFFLFLTSVCRDVQGGCGPENCHKCSADMYLKRMNEWFKDEEMRVCRE